MGYRNAVIVTVSSSESRKAKCVLNMYEEVKTGSLRPIVLPDQMQEGVQRCNDVYSVFITGFSSSALLSSFLTLASVIERLMSGVPFCIAGDPGTGVIGSTLGRCEDGRDGAAGATVILGVNLCGSPVAATGVAGAAVADAGVATGATGCDA